MAIDASVGARRARRRWLPPSAQARPGQPQAVGRKEAREIGAGQSHGEGRIVTEGVLEDSLHARVAVPAQQLSIELAAALLFAARVLASRLAGMRRADAHLCHPDRVAPRTAAARIQRVLERRSEE